MTPSYSTVKWSTIALLVWAALWIWIAVWIGQRVDGLQGLGDGLISAGEGIQGAAEGLGGLGDIPLVGGAIGAVVDQIDGVGTSVVDQGRESKDTIHRTAVITGAALAFAAIGPPLAVWALIVVPWWLYRRRAAAGSRTDDRVTLGLLAFRAVSTASEAELAKVSDDPVKDLAEGRYLGLAGLEMERLGLPSPVYKRERTTPSRG